MSQIPPPPARPPRTEGSRIAALRERVTSLPKPYLIGGALVLGLGGVYVGSLTVGGDTVAPGTTVLGVEIGDMTPEAAEDRLAEELAARLKEPLRVRVGPADEAAAGQDQNQDQDQDQDQQEQGSGAEDAGAGVHEVDPVAAGLALDFEQTVDQAERPGPLARLFGADGGELEPVVTVDRGKATATLNTLAEESGTELVEGDIVFKDGRPEAVEPRGGTTLDVENSVDVLRGGYLVTPAGDAVELPVAEAQPRTDAAEVRRAMSEFAEPAMSGPVELTAGDTRISLSPATIGAHLSMEPDDGGALEPVLDGAGLAADEAVAAAVEEAATEPVNAVLGLDGDAVTVVEDGRPGVRVDTEGLGDAVLPLLTRGGAERTGEVATEEVEPELSADNLDELGITEKMSSFTVHFDPAPYRSTNIGRAAELINGSLVKPGEVWSFNETVGERTAENGFVEGVIILDDRYQKAQGGGVSAVATTMFNAVFFAGVKPVEYGAHSFYIERYPEGREATVAWGHLDNRWENDSGNSVYIQASATDSSVTISFLGTRKYDEVESVTGPRTKVVEPQTRVNTDEECVPQPPLEGFDVSVDRVFRNDGAEVKRETYKTHYTPRDEVVCEPEGSEEGAGRPDPAADENIAEASETAGAGGG
ncbi:VanW family protein [Streptomyces aidingensis]|uniref:VanW like protein n=1 Tax=Streptomyces aidingensis TaxID=910347 RepID=A0A1I1S1W7_9ACTN|nr:VanW family protein [Streptomyces aidingensis]SFD40526.1 VanW like protein [Streptomyces aidingensis]